MRRLSLWLVRLGYLSLLFGCLAIPASAQDQGPMVAAANPHAAEAGMAVLRAGGGAVDAAIAVQAVLGLVEPQSSGIGGGAFLLHYSAKDKAVHAYDGREMAPAAAAPDLFLGPDGKPLKFYGAVVGGRSVGAPGVLRMLQMAHADHGQRPWKTLFGGAIDLAEKGFEVSPRLNFLLTRDKHLRTQVSARRYFYLPDGAPLPVGHVLVNRAYGETLRTIAEEGADALYTGAIARDIVETVQSHAGNPGRLTMDDLAGYRAVKRDALCRPYRGHRVCTMPPPTSGGIATLQILGILEHFPLHTMAPGSVEAVHVISEASRLAFADRGQYVADTDFVDVPVTAMLSRGYLGSRAKQIDPARSMGKARAGTPLQKKGDGLPWAPNSDGALPSTSHFTIVDGQGNIVSMTTSVENAFGSRLMVRGFLLNNQLTDFSFRPEKDGRPVANRVEPGKRPRSSMSPTIILDQQDNPVAAVGSPGGSRIIGYVTKTIIGVLDWNMSMQQAIDQPHFVNRNGTTDLEQGTAAARLEPALTALGHNVRVRTLNSGLHGIRFTATGLDGGADPRREGVVLTD